MPNPVAKSGWVLKHGVELTGGKCDCQSLSLVIAILANGAYEYGQSLQNQTSTSTMKFDSQFVVGTR